MKKQKRTGRIVIALIAMVFLISPSTVGAQTTNADLQVQIQALLEQISSLQLQIKTLRGEVTSTREEIKQVREELQILRTLRVGNEGEDVSNLQEYLSQFEDIYPEGLVTGFFGILTQRAIQRFQQKHGIVTSGDPDSTGFGLVGPRTRTKLNELFANGNLPPGLTKKLEKSGVLKTKSSSDDDDEDEDGDHHNSGKGKNKITICHKGKITLTIAEPAWKGHEKHGDTRGSCNGNDNEDEDSDDDDGDDDDNTTDTTAPIISNLIATSTTATTSTITWNTNENADGTIYYSTASPVLVATTTPSVHQANFITAHSIILSSLTATTTYFYIVESTDESGNIATSSEQSFTTFEE
ncbi:MAG: hypothetical protein COU08_04040 [Candidatus Harrisonbacteria bacterium CG10_big_fil_rev_8_21_14_0_10_42_17]|uniref:Fibronectin type-III domain-containing protein n=1 Tax=Candidatus Harrisonbacteria bacterium CG10_big_fil_rev_8_21_14_0_10_42_17 TaxID=1974584 RepID=A0A2M6WH85_9BACT|nr:MAG: hypothetical protein COU08_04040 [Candidatus Harrisonbacteria bacterium CG10_big_fil_rev_8_21_14_0_10_42_17]